MSDFGHSELTDRQRELLLEGLRYIRSARRYESREPSEPRNEQREGDLREIAVLMSQLQAAPVSARS